MYTHESHPNVFAKDNKPVAFQSGHWGHIFLCLSLRVSLPASLWPYEYVGNTRSSYSQLIPSENKDPVQQGATFRHLWSQLDVVWTVPDYLLRKLADMRLMGQTETALLHRLSSFSLTNGKNSWSPTPSKHHLVYVEFEESEVEDKNCHWQAF